MSQKFILFNGKQQECNEKTTINELFEFLETKEGDFADYFWKITGDLDAFPEKPKKNLKLGSLQGFKQNGKMLEISCSIQKPANQIIKKYGSGQQPQQQQQYQQFQTQINRTSQGTEFKPINQSPQSTFIPPESAQETIYRQPIQPQIKQQNPFSNQTIRKFKKAPTNPKEVTKVIQEFEIVIKDEGSIVEVSKLNGEFYYALREIDASEDEQQIIKDKLKQIQQQADGPNLLSISQSELKNVSTRVWFCENYRGLIVKWFSELYTIIYLSIN